MATEWNEDASAIVVYRAMGPWLHLVRRERENGDTIWLEAKHSMSGGQPSQPIKDAAALSPEELLEALRGPLGVK